MDARLLGDASIAPYNPITIGIVGRGLAPLRAALYNISLRKKVTPTHEQSG